MLNEADNIEPSAEDLSRSLRNYNWEVIFVDDRSNDGTQEAIGLLQRFGRLGTMRFLPRLFGSANEKVIDWPSI